MKKTFITLFLALSLILAKPVVAFAPLLYWVGASAMVHIAGVLGYYYLFTSSDNQTSNLVYITSVDTSTGEVAGSDVEAMTQAQALSFKSTITSGGTYSSPNGAVSSANYSGEAVNNNQGCYYDSVNNDWICDNVFYVQTHDTPLVTPTLSATRSYYWAPLDKSSQVASYVGKHFLVSNFLYGSNATLYYIESVDTATGMTVLKSLYTFSSVDSSNAFDDSIYTSGNSYTYSGGAGVLNNLNYLSVATVNDSSGNIYDLGTIGGLVLSTSSSTGSCSDGVQNGNETGIDTGGRCGDGTNGNCFDSVQNGNETGIDTGGRCSSGSGDTAMLDYLKAGDSSSYYSGDTGFDSTLTAVAKGSITNTLTSFISSNPIVSIFTGSSITAVDGTCSISGSFWGKSVTADFCWLGSSMDALGVFVFMIAGIYSFFIAWGRA